MVALKVLIVWLLAASGGFAANPQKNVVATIPMVADWIQQITDLKPIVLLESGMNSHAMELRPSKQRALLTADMIVAVGSGFDGWMIPQSKIKSVVTVFGASPRVVIPTRWDRVPLEDIHYHFHHTQWLPALDRLKEALGKHQIKVKAPELKRLKGQLKQMADFFSSTKCKVPPKVVSNHGTAFPLLVALGWDIWGSLQPPGGHEIVPRRLREYRNSVGPGLVVEEAGHGGQGLRPLPPGWKLWQVDPLNLSLDQLKSLQVLVKELCQ